MSAPEGMLRAYAETRNIVFLKQTKQSGLWGMNKTLEGMMIAVINPAALPALRIAGALFLVVNFLAGAWLVRHRRELFGPDPNVDGDVAAVRYLRIVGVAIPWLFITFRLAYVWVATWVN